MRLLLVRHATCDPVGHTLAGRAPGIALNSTGRAQAAALAERLAGEGITAVYSSPLDRAMETARAIADATAVPLQALDALTELEFGAWTGRAVASLDGEAHWTRFNAYRSGTAAPAGELALEAQARAMTALYGLRERHAGSTVAAVSHADVIKAVLGHLLGVPLDFHLRLEIDPASVTTVVLEPWGPRVIRVNEVVPPR